MIFDVDGTIADTERDGHRVAFNLAFEKLGMPDRWDVDSYGELLAVPGGRARLRQYLGGRGMGVNELDDVVPRLHELKNRFFVDLIRRGRIEARPGIVRLVDELQVSQITVGVATTGSRHWVEELLEVLLGAARVGRFGAVVTGEEASAHKPDPELHLTALDRLSCRPEAVVAVEDSALGLRSAKAAGLACLVVRNSYTAGQDFTDADLVVDELGEADHPAMVVADPHGLAVDGPVDLAVLRRLLAAGPGVPPST